MTTYRIKNLFSKVNAENIEHPGKLQGTVFEG